MSYPAQTSTILVGKRSAFTLIELMVSITLLVILAGVGVAGYRQSARRQTMEAAVGQVTSMLHQAQVNTQSGKKISCNTSLQGWQVNFTVSSMTLQEVCNATFSQSVLQLPLGITITTLPSPNPILFQVLNRGTNVNTSTQLVLSGFNLTSTVTVTSAGEIK